MRMPWQRGMWCDRYLESCELWLAGRIVRIRFVIPGLRCLQQSFTLGGRNLCRGLLSNNRRPCGQIAGQEESPRDCGDTIFKNCPGRQHDCHLENESTGRGSSMVRE